MRVLQHSTAIIRRGDSKILARKRIPHRGQIAYLNLVSDQTALDLKSNDDVKVIRNLVGLNPNQRPLDPIRRGNHRVRRRPVEQCRKGLSKSRKRVAPEWQPAGDEI